MFRYKFARNSGEARKQLGRYIELVDRVAANRGERYFDVGNVYCKDKPGTIVYVIISPTGRCDRCMMAAVSKGLLPDEALCEGCLGEGDG